MPAGKPLTDPLTGQAITQISGPTRTRCRFRFVSRRRPTALMAAKFIDDVSVARGNVVLADHGR